MATIPGAGQLSPAFRSTVDAMAGRLGASPDDLLRVMSFETGGSFSPAETNRAGSGATGLLQFLPSTAEGLGTTTSALAQMTPEGQLQYVEKYLTPYAGQLGSLQDVSMAVFQPRAMGQRADTILFRDGTRAYQQNAGLDTAKKGHITIGDYVQAVLQHVGLAPGTAEGATLDEQMARDIQRARGQRQDDISEQYIADKNRAVDDAMARDLQRARAPQPAEPLSTAAATPTPPPVPAPTSTPLSWTDRLGQDAMQVVGGARDAFVNTMQTLNLLGDWMREKGIGPSGTITVHVPEVAHADTGEGDLIRGASQFLTAFLPATRLVGALGMVGEVSSGLAAGALADFAAMDPQSPRMSNLINELAPALKNPLTTYLASSPTDTEAEGRLKNTLEGLGLGVLTNGVLYAAKALYQARQLGKDVSTAAAQGLTEGAAQATGQPLATAASGTQALPGAAQATAPKVFAELSETEIQQAITAERNAAAFKHQTSLDTASRTLEAIQQGDGEVISRELQRADAVIARNGSVVLGRGRTLHRFDSEQEAAQYVLEQRLARLHSEEPTFSPLGALQRALGTSDVHGQQDLPQSVLNRFVRERSTPSYPTEVPLPTPILNRLVEERTLPTAQALGSQDLRTLLADRHAPIALSSTVDAVPVEGMSGRGTTVATMPAAEARRRFAAIDEQLHPRANLPVDVQRRLVRAREASAAEAQALAAEITDPAQKEAAQQFMHLVESGFADTLPTEGRQLHINFDRINTTEDVKQTIATISEVVKAQADEQRRGVRTIPEIAREAIRSRYQRLDQILGITPGTALNDADAYAVRQVHLASAKRFRDLSVQLEAGNLDVAEEWLKQFVIASNIHIAAAGVRAEAGRTFRVFGVDMPVVERNFLQQLGAILAEAPVHPMDRVRPGMITEPGIDVGRLVAPAGRTAVSGAGEAAAQTAPEVLPAIRTQTIPTGGGIKVGQITLRPEEFDALRTLAARVAALPSDEAMGKFLVDAQRVTKADMFTELWYGALLSAPPTHVVNALDGALRALWSIPERYLTTVTGNPRELAQNFQAANAFTYGLKQGLQEGWQYAREAFRTGVSRFGEASKIDAPMRPAITAANLGLGDEGLLHGFVDLLGTAFRAPGRALLAADEFWKVVNYRMALHEESFRHATAEGLTGQDLARRIVALVNEPLPSLREKATAWANYQTLATPLTQEGAAFESLGRVAQHVVEAREDWLPLKIVMPFVRTPFNIARYAAEHSPLGLLSTNVREALMQGGAEGALARSKMALGTGTMALFGLMAAEGTITGHAPSDPALKATWERLGIQPYSVKIGDTYYAYNRIDLIGLPMGLAADFVTIAREAPIYSLDHLAGAILGAVFNNLTSKTYLQGLAEAIDAMTPGRGESDTQSGQEFATFLRQRAGSLIPSGVALAARWLDPVQRDARTLTDTLLARVPGMSDQVPAKLDLWGRERRQADPVGPDLLSPILSREYQPDAVDEELLRQQVPLKMPERTIKMPIADKKESDPVDLTPKQYALYVKLSAGMGVEGAQTLKEKVHDLITSPGYQAMSDGPRGGKSFLIQDLVQKAQEAGKVALRAQDSAFNDLLTKQELANTLRFTPQGQETLRNLQIGVTR